MRITNSDDDMFNAMCLVVSIVLCLFILLAFSSFKKAFPSKPWSNEEICQAIWSAEGGFASSKPYGIMLPKCSWENVGYCKRACINTIRNNRIHFKNHGYKSHKKFLSFLASRYAPVKGDKTGLNKNWLPNVQFFLHKNRGVL